MLDDHGDAGKTDWRGDVQSKLASDQMSAPFWRVFRCRDHQSCKVFSGEVFSREAYVSLLPMINLSNAECATASAYGLPKQMTFSLLRATF